MRLNMDMDFSLLDVMAVQAHCVFLSDLHDLPDGEKRRLARKLAHIPEDAATLFEWNDALEYLAQEQPQQTRNAARERLLLSFSAPKNAVNHKEI